MPCGQPGARSIEGIDYVTLRLPMEGAEGVHGGYLLFVSPQGEKEGEARRWRETYRAAEDALLKAAREGAQP